MTCGHVLDHASSSRPGRKAGRALRRRSITVHAPRPKPQLPKHRQDPQRLGYVKQDADQIEVLFTLIAERRSMLITSNLVFSQWDRIFRDPMTTAAAIDRLVLHSVILEFDVESYRPQKKKEEAPETLPR